MGRPGSFTCGVAVSGFSNKSEGRFCENMVISIAINGGSLSFVLHGALENHLHYVEK